MALAGMAAVYKSVGSMAAVIANLALIVSGALVPINTLGSIFAALKYLFPSTWGIELLRQVMMNDVAFAPSGVALIGLLLQMILFITAGAFLFNVSLARAKRQGTISTY